MLRGLAFFFLFDIGLFKIFKFYSLPKAIMLYMKFHYKYLFIDPSLFLIDSPKIRTSAHGIIFVTDL